MPKRYDIAKLKFIQQNISRARGRGTKAWNIEIDKFDAVSYTHLTLPTKA